MRSNKKILVCAMYILLGAALLGLGIAAVLDGFWSGMGGALIAVGVIRLVQYFRFHHDETYREKMEIETKDERNRFIQNKAWAWAGYLFVLTAAVCTIAFKLLGQDLLSMASAFAICFMMLAYWICWMVLRRKY